MDEQTLLQKILWALSDSSINQFLGIVVLKYKIMAALLSGPIFYYAKRLAKRTPWTSDDEVIINLEEKVKSGTSISKTEK